MREMWLYVVGMIPVRADRIDFAGRERIMHHAMEYTREVVSKARHSLDNVGFFYVRVSDKVPLFSKSKGSYHGKRRAEDYANGTRVRVPDTYLLPGDRGLPSGALTAETTEVPVVEAGKHGMSWKDEFALFVKITREMWGPVIA